MIPTKKFIQDWFTKWENGDFLNQPLNPNFEHHSPYGIIKGKKDYLAIVAQHPDKFLGHQFNLHNILVENNIGVVRYTTSKDHHSMDVTEWFYCDKQGINKIISYYDKSNQINKEIENYSND